MSLQTKCLTAAAVTHGLLILLVFVGSAFIPQKPKIEGPEFELVDIPDLLVAELNVASGGDPNAGSPQPQPQPQPQPPQPEPRQEPEPVKEPPKPVKQPDPAPEPEKVPEPKVERRDVLNPDDFNLKDVITKERPQPPKAEPTFNLAKAETRTIKPASKANDSPRDNDRTGSKAAEALRNALAAVEKTGGRVGINPNAILGPGGRAQMSYDTAVALIYEREFRRHPVPGRANEPAVEVEVVVRRDGKVIQSKITKRSGRAQFNSAVNQVLKNVNRVREFPSEMRDETRTIKINFNLDN